jgi:hypothetical protein
LVPNCEVVVTPKPRTIPQSDVSNSQGGGVGVGEGTSKKSQKKRTLKIFRIQRIFSHKSQQCLHPQQIENLTENPSKVFINANTMKKMRWTDGDYVLITPLVPQKAKQQQQQQNNQRSLESNLPQKVTFSFLPYTLSFYSLVDFFL